MEELASKGIISFENYLVTLHHSNYQQDIRKLLLRHINVKGKQVIEKWGLEIEIKNANPNDVMEIHWETNEALAHTMDDQERENIGLKKRIVKLGVALIPHPLFSKPFETIQPIEESSIQVHKVDKITRLLLRVRYFVAKSVKERA